MNKDTILIFQKPNLYFFPTYKDIVFSPFGIPEKSLRYLIYKVLYILRLPQCHIFWGDWQKHLKEAKQVIIFDYGYQALMEKYIHSVNPDCKVYLFFWNPIQKQIKNYHLFTDKNAIYSTDKKDCEKYNAKYNHIFYPKSYYTPYNPANSNKLFFIGNDKGRGLQILQMKNLLLECGVDCDIRMLTKSKDTQYLNLVKDITYDKFLDYDEYLENVHRCGILLDLYQEGQTALTMRVLESIYLSKKLITNNDDIANYDFYNANNIFLLPKKIEDFNKNELMEFLQKPFEPYPEEILDAYDFHHWKAQFK